MWAQRRWINGFNRSWTYVIMIQLEEDKGTKIIFNVVITLTDHRILSWPKKREEEAAGSEKKKMELKVTDNLKNCSSEEY